jgi:hypothetical protein
MIPAAFLYVLVTITHGQMTVKTGLTMDECQRAAGYAQGNACLHFSRGTGMTLVYQLTPGKYHGLNFNINPGGCQRLLESTALPAACVPLALPVSGCMS